MTPPADKILSCPACGTRVTGMEPACPQCGKKFDRYVKFECPFCGELILLGSKKCPICQMDLTNVSENVRNQSVDRNLDQLMNDLIEIEATNVKREDKRFCCPKCNWLLDGSEIRCPRCSQALTGKLGLQCPICATAVDRDLKECPRCGISLERVTQQAKPMVPVKPAPTPVPAPAPKPIIEKPVQPSVPTRPCPICAAPSPVDSTSCSKCGASFVEKISIPKAPEPPEEPKKSREAEEALMTLWEIERQAKSAPRERKLKTEKVTTVNIRTQPGKRGLSNGIGQVNGTSMVNGRSRVNGSGMVNGQSKVNGMGAVNGRSLVNGTGISNGLRSKARARSSKRAMFLTRWQFLAVLVAIAIVLPTFVILSYTKNSDEFSVDGKFGEWSEVTTYSVRIPSSSTRTNITEWAVTSQASDLFFYFRTQSRMMSSSEAESFYLFVDSDGSDSTGYRMESIGADYMLQLTGWNNVVNSTMVSQFSSTTDRYNWSAWSSIGSFSYSSDGLRLEAEASLPVSLSQSAKFLLLSKDASDRGAVSYTAPLTGGILVAELVASDDVASDGVVDKSSSVMLMTIRFSCVGAGGSVTDVNPYIFGATLSEQIEPFSLEVGQHHDANIVVDTSTELDGQLVSANLVSSGVLSTFASVEVVGSAASAYVFAAPSQIVIDGAFADWDGRLSYDDDQAPVSNSEVDIDEVGNVSTTDNSYFYVSVVGEMCSGTFVPAMVVKPSGSGGGGGGAVVVPRHTAEDILRIYVDSDRENSTGYGISLGSKRIGADQMIEIRGLFGKIVSSSEWDYDSGNWIVMPDTVDAAKDSKRIEIGVAASSLDGSSDIDYIVETTTWKGRSDLAFYDPSSTRSQSRRWVVDSGLSSNGATSMSYQRKIFYDGTNYWSFYFDGSNTVHRYSADDGVTWTTRGSVFTTSGVNETSIWYDSGTNTVYAVGDTSSASNNVYLQKGTVNAGAHTITWAASDSTLASSANSLGGKNTFISRDANGYIWVMSSNCSTASPLRYQISVFRSSATNSITSWVYSGQMLATAATADTVKGSVVPAGSGSDMWAIYTYTGIVASRKYTGSWQTPQTIVYTGGGSSANTENSPPVAVVDSKGVCHVVYGTGRKTSTNSIPSIEYAHNNTGATTFSTGLDLDSFIAADVGDYYPTISLESSTNNIYVYWLQSDSTLVPKTLMGRVYASGSWSNLTFESQTTYAKYYLNSIYSVSGEYKVAWQWTQNTTSPVQVLLDHKIPEFSDITLPIVGFMVFIAVFRQRAKSKKDSSG